MLCGLPTVQQAAIGDCLSFDVSISDAIDNASSGVNVASTHEDAAQDAARTLRDLGRRAPEPAAAWRLLFVRTAVLAEYVNRLVRGNGRTA
jgi:hypothetical protein